MMMKSRCERKLRTKQKLWNALQTCDSWLRAS